MPGLIPILGNSGEQLLILVAALLADAVIGSLWSLRRPMVNPLSALGGVAALLGRRLDRPNRSEVNRVIRGIIVTMVLVVIAAVAGVILAKLSQRVPYGRAIDFAAIWLIIGQGAVVGSALAVGRGLSVGRDTGAAALAKYCRIESASHDEFAIARRAAEFTAREFGRGVVAPVFWYLLLGLPGLLVHCVVAAFAAAAGAGTAHGRTFGMAAARLEVALGFFPARIAGFLLVAAALFVPTARPSRGFAVMWSEGTRPAVTSGWAEGAVAGSLDLALGGPGRPAGAGGDTWVGSGRARLNPHDLKRVATLTAVACLFQLAAVVGLFLGLSAS